MPLIQIYIKIPESPVFIGCISNKYRIFCQRLYKISSSDILPQISPERSSAPKKKEQQRKCTCPETEKHPVTDCIKHHKKSYQRQNTYQIVSQIQPKSQIFQISYQKLKHKMVLHILSSVMRILCRKIISS